MIQSRSLCLIHSARSKIIDVSHMVAVGGVNSSGVTLEGTKHKEDYFIASPSKQGIVIHPLIGKAKQPVEILENSPFVIGDMTLLLLPTLEINKQKDENQMSLDVIQAFSQLMNYFAKPGELKSALKHLLKTVISGFSMEKGLLITKNSANHFQLMAEHNICGNQEWLSETLIKKTLKSKSAIFLQNIIGSQFETSQSLMATGFISICAWPLQLRGETLGVLIIGSEKPHSGLTDQQKKQAEDFIQLAALMLKFHLSDLKLKEEVHALKEMHNFSTSPLQTNDSVLLKTCQVAKQVADTDLSVLICGETGVGKEVMARWIHKNSHRKDNPFVAINCGAIPENLLESLLFGHKKGSFTGAFTDQIGKIQTAHGGTLFLDEIGDLPYPLQVKLLRTLQEKVIEPLGSSKEVKIDVRVLAATHKVLHELVDKEKFREDLYYRLAEVTLEIPALRDRPGDIIILANSFLIRLNSEKRFSECAWQWIKNQSWQGNVRELQSTIKRAVAMSTSNEIRREHLTLGSPQIVRNQTQQSSWLGGESLEHAKALFVKAKVKKALELSQNKRNKAAELLGINPRTLFRYLETFENLEV